MNQFSRTDEQQALADALARVGAANKEIRMLKAALDLRDVKIAGLETRLERLEKSR